MQPQLVQKETSVGIASVWKIKQNTNKKVRDL